MRHKKQFDLATILVVLVLSFAFSESSEAALCAFRNPDRDVYAMFPQATGYRSVIKKLGREAQEEVEKFLGQRLDYDEGDEHTFYLILKDEDVLGVIRPHAERGRYGIVEMVWVLTLDGRIKDFNIQRSRERGTALVKAEGFRRQLRDKTLKTAFTEKKVQENQYQAFYTSQKSGKAFFTNRLQRKEKPVFVQTFLPGIQQAARGYLKG